MDRPIAHDRRKKRRMVVQRGPDTPHRGKWYPARTTFRKLGIVGPDRTAWEAVIHTGVMHQVRVHAAFVGIALAGDPIYGGGAPLGENPAAPFRLHHVGLQGPGISPAEAPVPGEWISLREEHPR